MRRCVYCARGACVCIALQAMHTHPVLTGKTCCLWKKVTGHSNLRRTHARRCLEPRSRQLCLCVRCRHSHRRRVPSRAAGICTSRYTASCTTSIKKLVRRLQECVCLCARARSPSTLATERKGTPRDTVPRSSWQCRAGYRVAGQQQQRPASAQTAAVESLVVFRFGHRAKGRG